MESLLEKGSVWLLESWQETQSKFSLLTSPKVPLDIKELNQILERCPRWECQTWEETTPARSLVVIRKEVSSNSRPILHLVPRISPVYGSCTVQPWLEKSMLTPRSQNWPTEIRFKESLGIRKVLGKDKLDVWIVPIL